MSANPQEPTSTSPNEEGSVTSELSPTLSYITVLLVSGKRANFSLPPASSVRELKDHIFTNWPEDWVTDKPVTVNGLKFVHLGKFLEDSHTLQDSKIPAGKNTVVHLNIKKEDPQDNLTNSGKSAERNPKCSLCSIL